MNAAAVAPQGVAGVFEMPVRATGRETGRLFLNSERDYRDQRCLTIVISSEVERQLAARLGDDVEGRLMGSVIAVRGMARRVRIDFIGNDGRPTGKYYYRTNLQLRSADDLTVAGETPRA
jgi:hypothetical protein